LERIKTLEELYAEGNKREFLRGRFIVFPHVGESGNFALLRSGFAAKYKTRRFRGGRPMAYHYSMNRAPFSLWFAWAGLFASLGIWLALPRFEVPYPTPWSQAETAVGGFVLAILAMVAGIGTFALRQSMVLHDIREVRLDPTTPEGYARVRQGLVVLWLLCAGIGVLGAIMIHYSGGLTPGVPYLAGAAALFVLHAPRPRFFQRVSEGETPSASDTPNR
jgi:hypothetical protein